MLFDWSAECAADDPVLVVPWSDPSSAVHFVDLREDLEAVDDLLEAEQHPPLRQALRALNAPRSPVFTAKCDAFPLDEEEAREALRLELDLLPTDAANGFASYIDLLWRDRNLFASFHQHEHLLHRIARRVAPLNQPSAVVECVIRPAVLDLTGPGEGFALSLYVKALGLDQSSAIANWASALEAAVAIFRTRDLVPNT